MPVLPGITDLPAMLEAIAAASARAGASYLAHQVLFLRSSAKKEFYPFLAEHFPRLAPRYRRIYGATERHTPEYREKVDTLVAALRRKHGLEPRAYCDGDAEEEECGMGTSIPAQRAAAGDHPSHRAVAAGGQMALTF